MYRLITLFAPVPVKVEHDTCLPTPPGRGPLDLTIYRLPSCRNLLTKAIAATHAPSIVPARLTGSGGGEVCAK